METMKIMMFCCLAVLILLLLLQVLQIFRKPAGLTQRDKKELLESVDGIRRETAEQQHMLKNEIAAQQAQARGEISQSVLEAMQTFGGVIAENMKYSAEAQSLKMEEIGKMQNYRLAESNKKLEEMRETVERKLTELQGDNNRKLDEMRGIVDEKLQRTINQRMNESFRLVNERLEQVYRGLGEMQTLASGVGDLKKVLSNVKTRGILGEVQLGAILREIMAPEQYGTEVRVHPDRRNVVEFAVKIPSGNGFIYLPIDSKFPGETYAKLRDAYETGDPELVNQCAKSLTATIRAEAKSIKEKYIAPPYTTEFAIMFLPFEGLYAEVVNRGMVEVLQREYNVNIAGPSTMAAMLNSLQMGFRSFAIQKRSGEVWQVLSSVRTEFEKFETVLQSAQQRLNQVNAELDKLVGVRTRAIRRKLNDITDLESTENRRDIVDFGEPDVIRDLHDTGRKIPAEGVRIPVNEDRREH